MTNEFSKCIRRLCICNMCKIRMMKSQDIAIADQTVDVTVLGGKDRWMDVREDVRK